MKELQAKRKMCHAPNLYCVFIFIICLHHVLAGPVVRSSRMVREIYPEVEQEIPDSSQTQVCIVGDVVYGAGESVPSDQPCLKCTCAPLEVRCVTEICVQQPGCKAIHRPNKCCPDYQCECQHEGISYANGERLPTAPGGECLVCYCRGGEVQCAEVGCYTRSDCEPRYVTGQCCPKYDHCPPREPLSDRIHHTTEPSSTSVESDITVSWLLSGTLENSTTYETSPSPNASENSDEGSGDLDATASPEDISSSPTNFILNSDDTKAKPSTPVTFSIKEIESKVKKTDEPVKVVTKVDKETQTDSDNRPKITIQEVIPSRTEYKITSSPQKDVPPRSVSVSPINPVTFRTPGTLLSTPDSVKILDDTNNELGDSESYASEKTEVYDHPPPVLRIGDHLLFIRQGQLVPEKDASTPTPVITLIGAEGLQIGLGSGELQDHEILPINSDEPSITLTSNPSGKHLDETNSDKDSNNNNTSNDNPSRDVPDSVSENETSAETTSPLSDITYKVEETDDSSKTTNDTSNEYIPVNSSDVLPTSASAEVVNDNVEDVKIITDAETNSTDVSNESATNNNSTSVEEEKSPSTNNSDTSAVKTVTSSLVEVSADDSEYIPEENPYYPAIPEDIMIFNQEDSTTLSADPLYDIEKLVPVMDPTSDQSKSLESAEIKQDESEEISVIPLKKTEVPEKQTDDASGEPTTILPRSMEDLSDVKPLSEEYPTKIIIPIAKERDFKIPLVNDRAALPDALLKMTATGDADSETTELPNSDASESNEHNVTFSDNTTSAPDEHVTEKVFESSGNVEKSVEPSERILAVENNKSKETVEVNDETDGSVEETTVRSNHSSLMSNEDASVEAVLNDSSQINTSDLVETLPGFEKTTEEVKIMHTDTSEEQLTDGTTSPKLDVEIIETSTTPTGDSKTVSHVEVKDFHEEIQKRDVVKKVLKDTFENPKENIKTELDSSESLALNLQTQKQNIFDSDKNHDLSTRSLNPSTTKISQQSNELTSDEKNTTKVDETDKEEVNKEVEGDEGNDKHVIQKVGDDVSKLKVQESADNLDTSALGALRDFFKSQYRHYQVSTTDN